MRRSLLTAGMLALALALAAAAGVAEAKKKQSGDGEVPPVQIEDSAAQLVEIRRFLAGDTNLAKMKLPRLQQRLHRAETYRSVTGLPPELDQALQQEIARVTREIISREPGGQAASPDVPQLEDPPLPPYDPQLDPNAPPPEIVPSPAAAAFLAALRPLAELNDAELHQQLSQAVALSQADDLSPAQRRALRDVIRAARAALRSREEQAP